MDGNSVATDGSRGANPPSEYFGSAYRVDRCSHRKLDLPLPPSNIDDF